MRIRLSCFIGTLCISIWLGTGTAIAWDYPGHRIINQLALASLPTNFPAFALTPTARERIAFLSGEPDRWRNVPDRRKGTDLALAQYNEPDHYIDCEELSFYSLTPETLPPLRYDLVAQLALARAAHPEKFSPIDPTRNLDHTRQLVGFLPWTISEYYSKLKSEFSYLKAFEEAGGTPEEIANAQANIIYTMGVMGHFVGDGSQPLHTTMYFNGWFGPNPHGYTTNHTFHPWIDGGYFEKTGGLKLETMVGKIRTAQEVGESRQPDGMFHAVFSYIIAQNKLVEPLYQLEKEGELTGEGEKGLEGRVFLEGQLVKAGQMLGDIWYTAWLEAPEDTYLEKALEARAEKTGAGGK